MVHDCWVPWFPKDASAAASGARSVAVKLIHAVFLGVNHFFGEPFTLI